jgi:single-stranded-DNA-specific exonuclease
MRWLLKPVPDGVEALARQLGMHPLVAHLVSLRGMTDETSAREFLNPRLASLGDPFELPEMTPAVQRLLAAVDAKEKVILFGDYDVDGVTSMALLHLTLKAYGLNSFLFLPHRMEEGYGMSRDGLARCIEEHGKPGLLVALDCGTTSLGEAAWLKEQGIDCLIIDHHELAQAGRPECVALVNPQLGETYHHLCTVGLVFKVAHALQKTRRLAGFDLKDFLDLVALGTVADLVPLIGENRSIVRRGLESIAHTKRPGMQALKSVAGVDGLVQTHHLGYRLGPRLNAAGRLDTALTSLQLLLTQDPAEAREYAELLDLHNRERQNVELRVMTEALAMVAEMGSLEEVHGIVLGSRSWHPGVIGIVASRISRQCHRPTILIAIDDEGIGKGSGRSIRGLSLVDAMNECRSLLLKGGGHAMAAGMSIEEGKIDIFRSAFGEVVKRTLDGEARFPVLEMDAEFSLRDMTSSFLEQYRQLEPFGQRNPEPLFLCRKVSPRLPGRVLKEKHLRVSLFQDGISMEAMYFNAPFERLPAPPWDVALRIQRNHFRGNETWQILIEDVRAAQL